MFEFSNLCCVCVLISFNLKVTLFNCHGIGTSVETIRQLATELVNLKLYSLKKLEYIRMNLLLCPKLVMKCNLSAYLLCLLMRIYCQADHMAVSVLCGKNHCLTQLKSCNLMIFGIELQSNNFTLLFLTVFLPYECDKFYDDYCFYLSKLQCIIDSANARYIFILCDFNANIQTTSIFSAELIEFCDNNNLCFLDKELLPPDSFTYISLYHELAILK